ncbi:MAG TPA: 3-carboxy-cis,cis-muconate cycloisomerase [Aliidongia sp.]|uniref:3-carboxy-cis,cis-muconate cycloisomerase n=1 Tax=Aliidongia sp. TaxID=1914230 RepID=UPI002DDD19C3|nr:3-carboxy-cis,cis-muconate cycloisomerase [Aliidongia sp.]HEV2673460.1 3-carboxy-cis,cis-muconate cycloisomerase [Aliidongia sp.]
MTLNPADSSVFGGLFGTDEIRALFDDRRRLGFMLEVEVALARAQAALGIIPSEAASAIAAAADPAAFDLVQIRAETEKAGQPVMALAKALTQAAGAEAGRWVHWGATTQDITDTALVLQLRTALDPIERDLMALIGALATQAERHRTLVMAGRSFLQQALPVSFGYKVAVWLSPLLRHIERLRQLKPRLLQVQFGGAVGTLASLGDQGRAVTERLAADLSLACPIAPWHGARDGIAELGAWLGLVAGSLAKFAGDVILLAQTEVGELVETTETGRGGSSTMPQKRNPILCTHIVAAASGVEALVPLLLAAQHHQLERAVGPWQAEALALPQALALTAGALAQAIRVAEGMRPDAARMRANLAITNGLVMAERVMMTLADRLGRSEAHHLVQAACLTAMAEDRPLRDILGENAEVASRLDPAALDHLMDPAGYLGESAAVVDRVVAAARAMSSP